MITLFFIQILLVCFLCQQPIIDSCRLHIFDTTYQLSPLSSADAWIVKDQNADSGLFSMQYVFNFCKPVTQPCKGETVNAFEALTVMGQVTDTCEIIGRDRDITAKYIDEKNKNQGFKLSYGSGDICQNSENVIENGQPRKVNFKVMCSEKQDSNWHFTSINSIDVTKCNLEFTINSPAGCIPGYSSGSSTKKISFFIILVLGIYFGAGMLYNQKVNQLSGMEALPHKDFWKEVPELLNEGSRFLLEKAKQFGQNAQNFVNAKLGKETENNSGYNGI